MLAMTKLLIHEVFMGKGIFINLAERGVMSVIAELNPC